VLLSVVLGLVLLGSAPVGAEPVYEEAPPTYVPAPVRKPVRFQGLRLNRGNGTAVLFVRVLEPGRVILHGRGIRRLGRDASQATLLQLLVRPKVRLARFLKQHGKGRIRPLVTLKPPEAVPATIERAIVLRRRRG